eukprot:1158067-Pelagomonas_calceolata.AAC.2
MDHTQHTGWPTSMLRANLQRVNHAGTSSSTHSNRSTSVLFVEEAEHNTQGYFLRGLSTNLRGQGSAVELINQDGHQLIELQAHKRNEGFGVPDMTNKPVNFNAYMVLAPSGHPAAGTQAKEIR